MGRACATVYVSSGLRFNAKAERVRDFQYLGAHPDDATVKHITLGKQSVGSRLQPLWPTLVGTIRAGLPEGLKDADLSKPVW